MVAQNELRLELCRKCGGEWYWPEQFSESNTGQYVCRACELEYNRRRRPHSKRDRTEIPLISILVMHSEPETWTRDRLHRVVELAKLHRAELGIKDMSDLEITPEDEKVLEAWENARADIRAVRTYANMRSGLYRRKDSVERIKLIARARELHEQGKTVAEISRELEATRMKVRVMLASAGVMQTNSGSAQTRARRDTRKKELYLN